MPKVKFGDQKRKDKLGIQDLGFLPAPVTSYGIIHLVSSQNFPKNWHFLLPDTHTYVSVSQGKKC